MTDPRRCELSTDLARRLLPCLPGATEPFVWILQLGTNTAGYELGEVRYGWNYLWYNSRRPPVQRVRHLLGEQLNWRFVRW
jgi:hypothetical protein